MKKNETKKGTWTPNAALLRDLLAEVAQTPPTYEYGADLLDKAEITEQQEYRTAAARVFRAGHEKGDAKCTFGHALCTFYGYDGAPREAEARFLFATAAREWEKMAEAGDGDAMYFLYRYWSEFAIVAEELKARLWLQRATKAENVRAIYTRAGCEWEDAPNALLQEALKRGYVPAHYALARLSFFGYYLYEPDGNPDRETYPVDPNLATEHCLNGIQAGDLRCKRLWNELVLLAKGFEVFEGKLYRYTGEESRLGELCVPEGVTEILPGAFEGYSIDTLILPATVTAIDPEAAQNIPKIEGGAPAARMTVHQAKQEQMKAAMEEQRAQALEKKKAQRERAQAKRAALAKWCGRHYGTALSAVLLVATVLNLVLLGCADRFHTPNLAMIITCSILAAGMLAWWITTVALSDKFPQWTLVVQAAFVFALLLSVFCGGGLNPIPLFTVLFAAIAVFVIFFVLATTEWKEAAPFCIALLASVFVFAVLLLILLGSEVGFAFTYYTEIDAQTGLEVTKGSYGWHIFAALLCLASFVVTFIGNICEGFDEGALVACTAICTVCAAASLFFLFFGELMGGFAWFQLLWILGAAVGFFWSADENSWFL